MHQEIAPILGFVLRTNMIFTILGLDFEKRENWKLVREIQKIDVILPFLLVYNFYWIID